MKSVLTKSSAKKTMRVATTFTGVVAGVASFAPAAKANPMVPYPYDEWIYLSSRVSAWKVCGWKDVGGGSWYCTVRHTNPHFGQSIHPAYTGSNWKDGRVTVFISGQYLTPNSQFGSEWSCNTNGAYHGHFRGTGSSFGVSLTAANGAPFGIIGQTAGGSVEC